MAQNSKPLFGSTPLTTIANVSVAKTSLVEIASPADAPDLRLLYTAPTDGGFIDAIDYQAIGTGTPAASIMNIWITDTAGANARIWQMITVASGSAISTTVKGVSGSQGLNYMNLKAGQKIFASFTALASNITYNVTAFCGDYTAI